MAVDSAQQTQLAKNTNQQGMKTFIRLACRISKKARSCIHRNKKQQSTSTSSSSSNKLTTATTTPTTTLTTPPKKTTASTEQCSNKKNKLEKRISSDFLVYSTTKPCQNKDQIENACAKTKTLETEICIGGSEVTKVNEYLKRPRRNAVFVTTDEEKAGLKLVLRYYIQTQSIKQFVL